MKLIIRKYKNLSDVRFSDFSRPRRLLSKLEILINWLSLNKHTRVYTLHHKTITILIHYPSLVGSCFPSTMSHAYDNYCLSQ